MRTIIIIGYKDGKQQQHKPETIYIGQDGVEAVKSSDKARESGKYVAIRRGDDTGFHPVAHVPFPKPEAPKAPKPEAPKDSQPQTVKE